MAIPQKTDFTPDLIRLAAYSKAMAHPVRLEILRILAEENHCICGELVDRLPYAQATVSQHLKELKTAGLIKGEIEGPKTHYRLDSSALIEVISGFSDYFQNFIQAVRG